MTVSDEVVTIRQTGTVPAVMQVPAFTWRCNTCGWVGVELYSEDLALREAADHVWNEHRIAICASADDDNRWGHPGHRWANVKGTDQCVRCGLQLMRGWS